jgi:hypothetical protein
MRKLSGLDAAYATVNALFPILILCCSIFTAWSQDRPVTGPGSQSELSRQDLDQHTPVDIAPEPTDPTERAIRTIRNRLHNDTFPAPKSKLHSNGQKPSQERWLCGITDIGRIA